MSSIPKIQIIDKFEKNAVILSDNSLGIYFHSISNKGIKIHLKPLNEEFKNVVFSHANGTLLNFQRDLIDEDDIEYTLDVMTLFNKRPAFSIQNLDQIEQLQQVLSMLKAEFCNTAASYIMLKTLLKVLLLFLIRYQNEGFLEQDINQKRVFQFLELMETTFFKEINAKYYADEMGISVKRLNQILNQKLNLTAKQIIQQRQITEAKRKLIKSEITTKELAFELGFNAVSSFSRFFKNNVGVSPSVFKTQKFLK